LDGIGANPAHCRKGKQMGNFIVSFRIERDNTYQERYESLKEKVYQIATSVVWDETTSLYVFTAKGAAQDIAYTLYYGTKVNLALGDVLLVVDPIASKYFGYGIKYPALLSAAIGMPQTT
jgi:hypothetical protein